MRTQRQLKNTKRVQNPEARESSLENLLKPYSFGDLIAEVQRQFVIEKNNKNNLYSYIIQNYIFNELKEYSKTHDMSAPGGHDEVLNMLVYNPWDLIKYSPRNSMLKYIYQSNTFATELTFLVHRSLTSEEPIRENDPDLEKCLSGYEVLQKVLLSQSENLDNLSQAQIDPKIRKS
ncbi:MAG: hypothetical protein JXB49_16370 [Bacteroidales bacterium]|nr:hypothetical protein [Bacteroidales bacterium]